MRADAGHGLLSFTGACIKGWASLPVRWLLLPALGTGSPLIVCPGKVCCSGSRLGAAVRLSTAFSVVLQPDTCLAAPPAHQRQG